MRSDRLRLTPVTVQNAGVLWQILQQPDLRRYQDLPALRAVAFTQMVAQRPTHVVEGATGRFEWLIYLDRVRKAVGWVSLRIAPRDLRCAEIGYSLVRDFRGRGIATEAVRMLVGEGFERANLERVCAYCVPENQASRRVLERLGFRLDGLLAHGATIGGITVDVLPFRMDRERWLQSKNSMETPASGYPA